MGLESNKAAHHIHVYEHTQSNITHIGWASSNIADRASKAISAKLKDVLSKGGDVNGGDSGIDLPRELTFLEVDTALPKISPLPSASAGAG